MNDAMTENELSRDLKPALDKVVSDHIPLLVKRGKGQDVVIVSKEDYSSMEETAYLLSSAANTKRLMESIERNNGEWSTFTSVKELKDEIDS